LRTQLELRQFSNALFAWKKPGPLDQHLPANRRETPFVAGKICLAQIVAFL
jgi:hypothetical protein